jgi:hypothetical protein
MIMVEETTGNIDKLVFFDNNLVLVALLLCFLFTLFVFWLYASHLL